MRPIAIQTTRASRPTRLRGRAVLLASVGALTSVMSVSLAAQGSASIGLRLMSDAGRGNCLACHTLAGTPGVQSNFAPAFDGIGSRLSTDTLRQWVTDARQIKPDTLMPPFGTIQGTHLPNRTQSVLTADEINDVVAALLSLR